MYCGENKRTLDRAFPFLVARRPAENAAPQSRRIASGAPLRGASRAPKMTAAKTINFPSRRFPESSRCHHGSPPSGERVWINQNFEWNFLSLHISLTVVRAATAYEKYKKALVICGTVGCLLPQRSCLWRAWVWRCTLGRTVRLVGHIAVFQIFRRAVRTTVGT